VEVVEVCEIFIYVHSSHCRKNLYKKKNIMIPSTPPEYYTEFE
jgi:hypothetical protein